MVVSRETKCSKVVKPVLINLDRYLPVPRRDEHGHLTLNKETLYTLVKKPPFLFTQMKRLRGMFKGTLTSLLF